MINVPARYILTIKQILQKHLPGTEVRAFGSRVEGKAKPYSDLDLVIMGEKKIDMKVLRNLKEEFEESDIPFRIDLLDWRRLSSEFQQTLKKIKAICLGSKK